MDQNDKSVTQLLDEYLLLLRSGGYTTTLDQPGPSAQSARDALEAADYGCRPEIAEFFSWAHYPEPAGVLRLFEYYSTPFSAAEAVAVGEMYRGMWFDDWPEYGLDPLDMLEYGDLKLSAQAQPIDLKS